MRSDNQEIVAKRNVCNGSALRLVTRQDGATTVRVQRLPFGAGAGAGAGAAGSGCLDGGGSVWIAHCDAASEACACGINPGSGASAFSTIRPVVVGESMISRSAAVTSSSSGNAECWSSVIRSSSITLRPAERSLIA